MSPVNIEIKEYCKGCGICIYICPKKVLTEGTEITEFNTKYPVITNIESCTGCRLCELHCPDFAIEVQDTKSGVWNVELGKKHRTENLSKTSSVFDVSEVKKAGSGFFMGNEACALGAIHAGCKFFAGYPITPASEILKNLARELPRYGGICIQMEDEIASISACIGASMTGLRAMTATSGPGFSLMMESIGYAIMTETPLVIVDVQRAGPATGQAGKPGQGDVMQSRYGTHGDYSLIALSPKSVQEYYELTIKAFDFADIYRVPVIILTDAVLGHLHEKVQTSGFKVQSRPESGDWGERGQKRIVGTGQNLLITGSTHTKEGIRDTVTREVHQELVEHLINKIENKREKIVSYEEQFTDDMEYLIVSYGACSRPALGAVHKLRAQNQKYGFFRPITIWPSPVERLSILASKVKKVFLVEMSYFGYRPEIERIVGYKNLVHIPKVSEIHTVREIVEKLKQAVC